MWTGSGRNIRHLPCVSRRTGETGVCMFAFACMKANGTHLGTCIDRFYFGSCCRVENDDPLEGVVAIPGHDNNTHDNHVPLIPVKATTSSTSTPSTTEMSHLLSTFQSVQDYSDNTLTETSSQISSLYTTVPSKRPSTDSLHVPLVTSQFHEQSSHNTTTTQSTPSSAYTTRAPTTKTTTTRKPTTTVKSTTTVKPTKPTTTRKPTRKPVTKPPPNRETTKKPTPKPKPTSSTTLKPPTKKPTTTKPTTLISTTKKPVTSNLKPTTTTKKPTTTRKPTTTTRKPTTTTKKPTTTTTTTTTTRKPVTTTQPIPTEAITTTNPSLTTVEIIKVTVQSPSSSPSYILVSSTNESSSSTTLPTIAVDDSDQSNVILPSDVSTSDEDTIRNNATSPTGSEGSSPTTTSGPSLVTWTIIETGSSATTATPGSSGAPSAPTDEIGSSTSEDNLPPLVIHVGDLDFGEGDGEDEGSGESTTDGWVLLPVSTPVDEDETSSTTDRPSEETDITSSRPEESPSPATDGSTSTATVTQAPTVATLNTTTEITFNYEDPDLLNKLNMSNYKQVCGRRLFPESRIVGGEKATFGKWPWQISLRQWRTNTYLHKCGAALLNENWAITAAHCVENVPPIDLLLRLGEHDLSSEEEPYGYQERRVQIVASHPQFDPRTFEYDLALLRFYEPITFQPNIVPVCVPQDDRNFVGETAHVTGWGRLYEDGPLPSVLQEVSVPVINNSVCETMYRSAGYIEHIPEIFICAGWKKGGFDSCEGDSGGPMVIQRDDRRWLLAGVISWGIGCAEPNQPGVYTRISEFREWINQILQF